MVIEQAHCVEIKFTRHARRRAKPYGISLRTITEIVSAIKLRKGSHAITKTVTGFKFPVKIVFVAEGSVATIITAYPLKRGRKK